MNEVIAGLTGAVYSAATGFALAFQATAAIWPHQAALAVSAVAAVASFYLGRLSVKCMRLK